MAVLPLLNRRKGRCAQSSLARLPVLAAAFLIALFGLLAGSPRGIADIAAAARPVDDRSDRSPVLTKRDPMRTATVAERKDGTGNHLSGGDGLLAPATPFLAAIYGEIITSTGEESPLISSGSWPGALPRAPPFHV